MSIYDKISELCKNREITIMKLEQELGFSNGSIGKLKKGGTIRADRLEKIADFFGITTASLLGRDANNEGQDNAFADPIFIALSALINIDPNYRVLLEVISNVKKKDVIRITQIIRLVCEDD